MSDRIREIAEYTADAVLVQQHAERVDIIEAAIRKAVKEERKALREILAGAKIERPLAAQGMSWNSAVEYVWDKLDAREAEERAK